MDLVPFNITGSNLEVVPDSLSLFHPLFIQSITNPAFPSFEMFLNLLLSAATLTHVSRTSRFKWCRFFLFSSSLCGPFPLYY